MKSKEGWQINAVPVLHLSGQLKVFDGGSGLTPFGGNSKI